MADEGLESGDTTFTYNDENRNRFCRQRWCVSDCCGISCAVFTWILLSYGQFCALTIMMVSVVEHPIHQTANFIVFECLFTLALVAHLKTMLTNPGTVPKGTLEQRYIKAYTKEAVESGELPLGDVRLNCRKCACIRPQRSHHCSVCNRCIRRMDHHCPWVNNCVGENNQKSFVLFTMYISLASCHMLYWAVWQFVLCINEDWRQCSAFSPPATTVMLIVLLFESILFSIFAAVMFGTQLSAICMDQTGIESLKNETYDEEDNRSPSSWKFLQAVFGGPFSIQWLNPLALSFVSEKAFEFYV